MTVEVACGLQPKMTSDRAQNSFYRPELDALRFLAFFLVFLHHASPFTRSHQRVLAALHLFSVAGGFGIDVFFLLSGYLIAELLRQEKSSTGSIDLKAFYMRRILRIWPLYFLFLFGVAFFTRNSYDRMAMGALCAFSLFFGNWYCASRGFVVGPTGVLWTVSIEEQFYLVWPLIAKALGRTQVIALCAALIAAAEVVKIYLLSHIPSPSNVWCNTFARMDTIAAGVLTCYLLQGRIPRLRTWTRVLLLTFATFALYESMARFGLMLDDVTLGRGMAGYFLGLAAAVSLFFALLGAWNSDSEPAFANPMRHLGRISYGLYVFHVLAIGWWGPPRFAGVRTIPALATTILFAWLSYSLVERPFLRLRRRFVRVVSDPLEG